MNLKTREEISSNLLAAMKAKDENGFTNSLQEYGDSLAKELKAQMQAEIDGQIVASRGKALTSAEMKFAEVVKVMAKAKLEGEKMALTDTDPIMPESIITQVFEDITIDHPLLAHIDFQNTSYSTKWLMSKNAIQKAVWGAPDAEATEEIAASFLEMDMQLLSLIAYIPVSWALIDLGPNWIITYVVAILKEALANGLENGIINGTGNGKEPVGLMMDIKGKLTGNLAAQTFEEKEAIEINKFDPASCGKILDILSTTPNGNFRNVSGFVLAVNPRDYWTKIFPAITVMGANGQYVYHSMPCATDIVRSSFIPQGKAIAFIDRGYWMGLGQSGTAGKLMYSDDMEFLKRKRFYMISLYANGQPKDNNCAVVLNIENLQPGAIAVTIGGSIESNTTVSGTVKTKNEG